MISFKSFLLQENPKLYIPVTNKLLADRLKKNAYNLSDALKQLNSGHVLYRGMPSKEEFYFHRGYGADETRSPTTKKGNNFHAMIESFPSWNKIQSAAPRNKAIICTSELAKAQNHGTPYVILPENGTQLVVSPSADIHQEKWKGISGFGERNGGLGATGIAIAVGSLLAAIFGEGGASTNKTSPNFIPNLKKVTAPLIATAIKNATSSNQASTFKHFANMLMLTEEHNLFAALNDLMSPEENGFILQHVGNPFPKNREIWFNGKFAAIKMQQEPSKELAEFCTALKLDINRFIL